jgi:hypothetical protein
LEEAFSRDFTINALHQDLITGEITDPTRQGFDDIKAMIIKTPVPAEITLTDDPRRVYRAINLAARYDFGIAQDIKDFTIANPDLFSSENVKDKYIAVKIGKALKENQELTLSLLKELNLFKNVPLSGYFKDVLIENKILVDYLESSALDHKTAFMAGSWEQYESQGPAYQAVGSWWRNNSKKVPGSWDNSYTSWSNWYMDKYRGEWGGKHKSPEETLEVMKGLGGKGWGLTSLIPKSLRDGFKNRKDDLYGLLGINDEVPAEERTPERAKEYVPVGDGKVYAKPGVNVENVTSAVKNFMEALGKKAAELGVETPIITSGWRSVENQAGLMGRNWNSNGGMQGGREYLVKIYGQDYGSQMADVFEQHGFGRESVDPAVRVIKSRPVGSYHIANPGMALDISLTSGIKEVLDTIKSEGVFDIKIVDETDTAGPHYHVSIRSENSRLASIRDRKERLRKLSTTNSN